MQEVGPYSEDNKSFDFLDFLCLDFLALAGDAHQP